MIFIGRKGDIKMFDLYSNGYKELTSQKVLMSPSILFTLEKSKVDLKEVYDFYRNRDAYLDNRNIIVRIINTFNVDVTKPFYDYLEEVDYKIEYISRHFQIASPRSFGIFHDDYFYIEHELYEDYFNLDWKEIIPIKPFHTTNQSLRMDHPEKMMSHHTFAYIDYRALMIQYYYWAKEQISLGYSPKVHTYVYQYALTNMIQCFFNLSLINLAFNKSTIDYPNTHSIFVFDRTNEYLKIFKKFRKYARLKPIHFANYMSSIPLLDTDGLEYLKSPLTIYNSYNIMPYFYTYADYFKRVLDITGKNGRRANHNHRTEFNLILKYLRSSKSRGYSLGELDNRANNLEVQIIKYIEKG